MTVKPELANWLRSNSQNPTVTAIEGEGGFVLIEEYNNGFSLVTALSTTPEGIREVECFFAVRASDVLDVAQASLTSASIPF